MKITYQWDPLQPLNEVNIIANEKNQAEVEKIAKHLNTVINLSVINPTNDRKLLLPLTEIECFESFGHLCKVFTKEQDVYLIQKRLKEIPKMNLHHFQQINNATILNIAMIQSFHSGEHARLEVHTTTNQSYIVSRHYAKQIKEKLQ
ncbi:LytTR family DNA-binding domain-containing protein [Enterococcus sp.]|uniref:LytTR family DNA-binding domain-containing protein n=1 Tax=Enterococcus sp. TaxID=35783 RepID=UPI002FC610B7